MMLVLFTDVIIVVVVVVVGSQRCAVVVVFSGVRVSRERESCTKKMGDRILRIQEVTCTLSLRWSGVSVSERESSLSVRACVRACERLWVTYSFTHSLAWEE